MWTKINVAEILKNKPQGTKLYADAFGELEYCGISNDKDPRIFVEAKECTSYSFYNNGKYNKYGEPILFPSKKMRDWEKFAWKKGDVLVNKDEDVYIIFERFADDTYCSFVGKYYLWKENNDTEQFCKNERLLTSDFQKAGKDAAQTYINTIEEKLGGKLNRHTLEVEKTQPEFKDGDIVYMGNAWNEYIGIIKNRTSGNQIETYAHCHKDSKEKAVLGLWLNKNDSDELRLATNSEKQQLFDALAKEGKAWDAEKKAIVDLKPKVELKPFDKVLVKDNPYGSWEPAIFWEKVDAIDLHPYMVIGGKRYRFCEPYGGNEHLLDN